MSGKASVPTAIDWTFDAQCAAQHAAQYVVCGVDEAGRGPLCGSVVAGACILPSLADVSEEDRAVLSMLNDSKKLTEKKRERLYEVVCRIAPAYGIGEASPGEIDEINILNASLLAMRRAVHALQTIAADNISALLLIDGNRTGDFPYPSMTVVHGDALSPSIAAASILAKVTRDRLCKEWDGQYPGFGISGHKGYPTQAHMLAVYAHVRAGGTLPPIYRRSFLGFLERDRDALEEKYQSMQRLCEEQ